MSAKNIGLILLVSAGGFLLLNSNKSEDDESSVSGQPSNAGVFNPVPLTPNVYNIGFEAPDQYQFDSGVTKKDVSSGSSGSSGTSRKQSTISNGVNYANPNQFKSTGNSSTPKFTVTARSTGGANISSTSSPVSSGSYFTGGYTKSLLKKKTTTKKEDKI